MKKRITILLLMLLGLFFSWSVNAAEKEYKIGMDVTYAPFEFTNDKGKLEGIDVDILKAIAKEEHLKLQLDTIGFNGAVQAAEAGQINGIMAGMMITEERKQHFNFSNPYFKSGVVMISKPGSRYTSLASTRGQKIAIKTGTAAAAYAQELQKKYQWKLVTFDETNNVFNDVLTGNAVACFEEEPIARYSIKTGVKLQVQTKAAKTGYYGFAVKKGTNGELLAAFNRGLAKIKKNGEYDRILSHYLSNEVAEKNKSTEKPFFTLFKENAPLLMKGLKLTLLLSVLGILGATVVGILIGLLGVMPNKLCHGLSEIFIYTFRGLPVIVLALFIYSGFPLILGFKIPAMIAGVITLSLNEGAYIAAFVKGGIQAVDKGQMEAARSLGLSYGQALMKIVLPQGLKLMIPSFVNQFIMTLKDTSILSVIGLLELTQMGKMIIARNMEGFRIWMMVAIIYVVIITLLTLLSQWLQKKVK
ncbi:ABC transporter substrate-binding protein/permease [Catellicoccus marimammalium]|uniref:/ Glutamine transport system permease protein GlnP n=1 Tax=Catellicoccus marimammalium M35/04/3 TaxID=1234409 RepID=K8ZNB9_9ENTE|nr:ABC transporter substrate-binding protein/permease [Catellicoccus marimammalium]EKU27056.1 / Glutamine transport system permease protein GlnP [Catellicoccus marimammalium M35/04/3]